MKKCSTNVWNAELKKAEGCDYIEWINGTTEKLDEDCPECGKKLVLYTTASGKKMKNVQQQDGTETKGSNGLHLCRMAQG
jgi:ssDNA-binding Zn-finger/Zn-ribbon topoisomerase 1